MWNEDSTQAALRFLTEKGRKLIRHVLPRKIKGSITFGCEDPALTGYVGSAITAGVQSNKGVGVTIKHYITNNQETNRSAVNTSVSERTLREIYLKGFEMVVKSAQPMAIMSSYNKVNVTYACENFDLLTSVPRGEWGFDGMVMTDWGAGNRAGKNTGSYDCSTAGKSSWNNC